MLQILYAPGCLVGIGADGVAYDNKGVEQRQPGKVPAPGRVALGLIRFVFFLEEHHSVIFSPTAISIPAVHGEENTAHTVSASALLLLRAGRNAKHGGHIANGSICAKR